MNIIQYPNPILREISKEVKLPLSAEDKKLLDDMYNYLKENEDAVGLSAIQVGVPKRMCAIRIRDYGGAVFSLKLVNPRIVGHSNTQTFMPEGCLSVPENHDEDIPRWTSVKLIGYNAITGKNIAINFNGSTYISRVLQHELDHMDGKLYIDYIEEAKE